MNSVTSSSGSEGDSQTFGSLPYPTEASEDGPQRADLRRKG